MLKQQFSHLFLEECMRERQRSREPKWRECERQGGGDGTVQPVQRFQEAGTANNMSLSLAWVQLMLPREEEGNACWSFSTSSDFFLPSGYTRTTDFIPSPTKAICRLKRAHFARILKETEKNTPSKNACNRLTFMVSNASIVTISTEISTGRQKTTEKK